MPATLEVVLWSAALAAWLMMFFAIIGAGLKPLSKSIRRLSNIVFRVKAN
ncbi:MULTISPECIES: hypothetical protein [Bradyrhizobium]|nr:hypothetical protein [Bradyrhizobium zhengyangense]MCG2641485.1 hypothetical protein [Bradyrhizobium zhengyangense]